MNPVLFNQQRREIRCPGFLGARLEGRCNQLSGVGDGILLDFTNSFFAVADGSDRNTSASREFMINFSRMLTNTGIQFTGRIFERVEISDIRKRITEESGHLLASLPFGAGSTFTGVLILESFNGMAGIVMHTGDSYLICCDLKTRIARQYTENNFWMVGRSGRFFQIDEIPIDESTILVLATDGFDGIKLPPGCSREEFVMNMVETYNPDAIPDRLFPTLCSAEWDDVALITFYPEMRGVSHGAYIIGGTSQQEELMFKEKKKKALLEDQFIPVSMLEGDEVTIL